MLCETYSLSEMTNGVQLSEGAASSGDLELLLIGPEYIFMPPDELPSARGLKLLGARSPIGVLPPLLLIELTTSRTGRRLALCADVVQKSDDAPALIGVTCSGGGTISLGEWEGIDGSVWDVPVAASSRLESLSEPGGSESDNPPSVSVTDSPSNNLTVLRIVGESMTVPGSTVAFNDRSKTLGSKARLSIKIAASLAYRRSHFFPYDPPLARIRSQWIPSAVDGLLSLWLPARGTRQNHSFQ